MDYFQFKNSQLYAEDVPVSEIADRFGTPCYVYSKATLEKHFHAFNDAFGDQPHEICYAVKANSNLKVLNVLAKLGSGFDIVSEGELRRVLKAGGSAAKTVFSGVGKQANEIRFALEAGISCFNIESEAELDRINEIGCAMQRKANISFRVNPDVDARTHPYISTGLKENKFGVDINDAFDLYRKAARLPGVNITGIDCHIGSQLTELSPFLEAMDRILAVVDQLAAEGIEIEHMDLGGGLGVRYNQESPPSPAEYIHTIKQKLGTRRLKILLEPGRAIAANAGLLLTRVEYIKKTSDKNFLIVDAAMNDLLRPSLYNAWQDIVVCDLNKTTEEAVFDVVGPVCETGDFLGKARRLAVSPGDLLAIRTAGAYGFVMSSNYNTRNRPPEIMVEGDQLLEVRSRETFEDQIRLETL